MQTQQLSRFNLAILLIGAFTVSFGVLSFEVSLTRIFSVMLDYHYTFLVVSLALFGLGLGGVIAHYLTSKLSLKDNLARIAFLIFIFSLLITFLTLFSTSVPNLDVSVQMLIMFLPFLISGTVLAIAYKLFVSKSSLLHFADLIGAALGSLAIVFFINWAGAPTAVIFISIITLISSALFSLASKKKLLLTITLLAIIGMSLLTQFSSNWNIRPGVHQAKEISNFIYNPSIGGIVEDSKWTSFGQVDLITTQALPHEKVIFVDGSAGTSLYHFNGNFSDSSNSIVPSLRNTTIYFPYYLANKERSLVIGPGGGVDVLTALMAGVNHIDAVEVNPGIVRIVKEQAAYNGGIYTNYSNVHLTIDDGRSYIKRSNQKYDVIMLNIPITKTAQGTLGYSLAENYLFTTESFNDYLNQLNDDGFLTIIAHNQEEIYKLVTLAYKVLSDQGIDYQQIWNRIAVVGSESSHNALPIFMLKKTPFTSEQTSIINTVAPSIGLNTFFVPRDFSRSIDPYMAGIASGRLPINTLATITQSNLDPPTDDDPFFYKFNLGLPDTIILMLAFAVLLCIMSSLIYIIARRKNKFATISDSRVKYKAKFSMFKLYCFASLGFGFMAIEVALIQKFILFLGEPTSAISFSLFSLLLTGGIGSLFSRKWLNGKQLNAFKVSLILAILTVSYIFILPLIFNITLSFPTAIRFLTSFVIISPLGFLMGIPFPTVLGYIKHEHENDVVWLWCINGAFSVLGGVVALVIAMTNGFNAVLLVGASSYIALFVIGRRHELRLQAALKAKMDQPRMPKFKRTWRNGKPIDKRS